jgi:transcriptional regulator with XRE-family HTH domain
MDTRQPAFGKFLKDLRKKKNLTIDRLAKLAGISPSYLSRIERGKRNVPNALLLKKLAPHLELSSEDMMIAAGYLNRDLHEKNPVYNSLEPAPAHWQEIIKDPSLDAALREIGSLTEKEKEWLLVYLKVIKLHRDKREKKS